MIVFSWICIFPDELAQRACWLSSLAIKAGNWSFLSFRTDEARRAAMSSHHWANSSQIYLSVSFEQKALASCHFIYFSLFVSFHSFPDRKKKKKGFILSSREDFYFCLFWEDGVWLVLTDLSQDAQTFVGPPPLMAVLKTAGVESRGPKGTRNSTNWDWPDFSVLQSHLAQMKRGKQSIFSILEIARNSEEIQKVSNESKEKDWGRNWPF